jgi:uncharacterized damage-inducible protein DinB
VGASVPLVRQRDNFRRVGLTLSTQQRNVVSAAAAAAKSLAARFFGGRPMKKRIARTALIASLLTSAMWAQSPGKTLTSYQAVLELWNDIGRKLIAMAEDLPEDKYDFKPTPAQRSFAEQLLHAAGSNDLFTSVAKGEKPVDDESRDHYKTKAAVVAYVKKSFADGAAMIKAKGDAGMAKTVVSFESHETLPLLDLAYELIEHSGEHYGQLVVYYRVAGLVPPESRPQK